MSVPTAPQPASTSIVFIDTSIQDYQAIAAGIAAGNEVVLIDGGSDGLLQIAAALAGRSGIDAVHVFSHGSDGQVALGTTHLTAANVGAYADALATIGAALNPDADLLLYGCDVGAGTGGQALMDALAQATGADVAASTDLTGSAALGGNWVLERSTGTIEAALPFGGSAPAFDGLLALVHFDGNEAGYYSQQAISKQVSGVAFSFGVADPNMLIGNEPEGIYAYASGDDDVELVVSVANGYSFDLGSLQVYADTPDAPDENRDITITITRADSTTVSFTYTLGQDNTLITMSNFSTTVNDVTKVVLSSNHYAVFNNFEITDVKLIAPADTTPPVITGVSIPNTPMKIGSIVTATITVAADSDTYTLGAGSTVGGYALGTLVKTGDGSYTASFTVTAGGADFAAGANIPVNLVLRDSANNASSAYTAAIAQAGDPIDANRPAPATVGLRTADDSGTSSNDGVTRIAQPTLKGSAEANSTVTLTIDGVDSGAVIHADGAGNWAWTPVAALADGAHSIVARATDAAGNVGAAGATLSVVIDTIAPATTAGIVAFSADTGDSSMDLVTNAAQQTIAGNLSAALVDGERVMVSLDNGALWQEALSASGGNTWSLAGQTLVSSNTLLVKVVDLAGNDGPVQGFAYVLDTAPPSTRIGAIAISNDSGASASDFITRSAAQTVSAVLSSPLDGSDHVYGSNDGGASWTDITSRVSGTTLTWATSLRPGANTLAFRVVDTAGNQGAVSSQAYTLDTGAPAASVTTAAIGAGNDVTTARSSETGSVYLVKSGLAIATAADLEAAVLAGSATKAGVGAAATDTVIATTGLAAGGYLVYAVDVAGNVSAASSGTVTLLAAPAAVAASVSFSNDSGASSTDFVTRIALQDLSGTLSAASADGERVEVSLDNGHSWQTAANLTGSSEWTLAGQVLAGSGTLQVRVSNAVASSNVLKQVYVLDTVAPGARGLGFAFSDDTGASATDLVTHTAAQTISGTLSADLAAGDSVWVSLDDGASFTLAFVDGPRAWSLPGQTLASSGTLRINVIDLAGNVGPSTSKAYVLDTVAPSVTAGAIGLSADSGSSALDLVTKVAAQTVHATLSAGLAAGDALLASSDGGLHWTDISASVNGSMVDWAGVTLQAGTSALQFKVRDLAGNEGPVSSQPYTLDTVAPVATGAAIVFSNDSGVSAKDLVTNQARQTISGILDRATANDETVRVSLDDGANWIAARHVAGTSGWSLDEQVLSGSGTLRVQVLDAAGNLGAVFAQAYVLDTIAPTASVAAAALGAGNAVSGARSSEAGTLYLAKAGLAVSGVADLEAAVLAGSAVRADAPAAATDTTIATTGLAAGEYVVYALDRAGNLGPASATTVTLLAVPEARAASVALSKDSGVSATDFVTKFAAQDLSGTLSAATVAGERVEVSLDDGRSWQSAANDAGSSAWRLDGQTLAGSGTLQVRVSNAVASSEALRQIYVLDSVAPAAPGAPLLAPESDSGITGDGVTNVTRVVLGGNAEALAEITLVDSDGSTVIGTARADADGAWHATTAALADGLHAITVRQVDRAGNLSAPGAPLALTVDTTAPAQPSAPALADGTGTGPNPVIAGTAEANATITLYDGAFVIGRATADALGVWRVPTALGYGSHALTVVQVDTAGNKSAPSAAFALEIAQAPATPTDPVAPAVPDTLVDGMPVQLTQVILPGGMIGSAISVPIVGAGRSETSGASGVADIPLATGGAGTLLLAQLAPGYGLSASGANVGVAAGVDLLIASIKAATPSHAAADQGHLTGNGQDFLAGLAGGGALLVQTVKPVSAGPVDGMLTLSGPAAPVSGGQSVALVIDAGGLAAGSTIALQQVDFAAVIGSAKVVAQGASMVLSGDAASQYFTLAAGGAGAVFAGGGDDTLAFGSPSSALSSSVSSTLQTASGAASGQLRMQAATATTAATLHGGLASDTALFSGVRADYQVEQHNGYLLVVNRAAPEAKALLVNVEQLQFSDATLKVADSAALDTVAGLYQTVLGRQADLYGFAYWADQRDAGASWGSIALHMIDSAEHDAAGARFDGNAGHDIGLLYQALFERAPEAAGLAYWEGRIAHGATLEQVASEMVQSVEMVGHQRSALDWDFTM